MNGIEYEHDKNKTITSDMELFDISMNKDKYYLMSLENFVAFVKGCEREVRKHPDYDNFVSAIRELKMEHCQVLGNISRYDATIEMHHGPMLTLFDYCAIVAEWMLKHKKRLNTFSVAKRVIDQHFAEHVQVVMLSKTAHQLVDTGEVFINLNQGIGNVNAFLQLYHDGIDKYIDKINEYIDLSKKFKSNDSNILNLEKNMVNWSYRKQPNGYTK